MMKQPHLGRKIAELRKAKGFTQEELVEKCNLSVRTLQRIESGDVSPRCYTQRLIFKALEYDIHDSAGSLSMKIETTFSVLGKWLEHLFKSFLDLFNLKTNTMKKLTILTFTFLLIGFGLFALCTKSHAQTIAEVTQIVSAHNSDYVRWFNNASVDSLLTQYREDASILPWAHGKAEIRELLRTDVKSGYMFKELRTESVSVCDTIAVEKGSFRILTVGGEITGMYITEWRLTNKLWLIVNEISRME